MPNSQFGKEPAFRGPGTQASAQNVLRNWLECIATRKRPVANEEEGYYSSIACYMANRAFQTKSRVTWDSRWDI